MEVKFNNEEFSLSDFEDGKIIIELKTSEGYYIEPEVFKVLEPFIKDYTNINNISLPDYSKEEIQEFLDSLIQSRILISKLEIYK